MPNQICPSLSRDFKFKSSLLIDKKKKGNLYTLNHLYLYTFNFITCAFVLTNFSQSYPTLNFSVNHCVIFFEILVTYIWYDFACHVKHHHKRWHIDQSYVSNLACTINKIIDKKLKKLMIGQNWLKLVSTRAHMMKLKG